MRPSKEGVKFTYTHLDTFGHTHHFDLVALCVSVSVLQIGLVRKACRDRYIAPRSNPDGPLIISAY